MVSLATPAIIGRAQAADSTRIGTSRPVCPERAMEEEWRRDRGEAGQQQGRYQGPDDRRADRR